MLRAVLLCMLVGCGPSPAPDAPERAAAVVVPDAAPTASSEATDTVEPTSDPIAALLAPADGWTPRRILALEVTRREERQLDVHGTAKDPADVAIIAARIRDSALYSDVQIHSSEAIDEGHLFHFSMVCSEARSCDAAEVTRVWREAIANGPSEVEPAPRPRPTPSTLTLIGIVHIGPRPSIMLRDDGGMGWIMRVGDTWNGEKLIRVAPDHAVLRASDGTEKRMSL